MDKKLSKVKCMFSLPKAFFFPQHVEYQNQHPFIQLIVFNNSIS